LGPGDGRLWAMDELVETSKANVLSKCISFGCFKLKYRFKKGRQAISEISKNEFGTLKAHIYREQDER
jgi:hypothetical protein